MQRVLRSALFSPVASHRLMSSFIPKTLAVPQHQRDEQLQRLIELVDRSQRVLVVSGAGLSTESNIPDYRGEFGSYRHGHKPTLLQEFLNNLPQRQRYWARGMIGYEFFAQATPNAGHLALERLSQTGKLLPIITQNVDGLHQKAARGREASVVELHGTGHTVICMECRALEPRLDVHARLRQANDAFLAKYPHYHELLRYSSGRSSSENSSQRTLLMRADADADLDSSIDFQDFELVQCTSCNSPTAVLKPHVVFFGESIPRHVTMEANRLLDSADLILAVGTSLQVFSAFRLARIADERKVPIAIVNIGETRADSLASIKVEDHCGKTLVALADAITRQST